MTEAAMQSLGSNNVTREAGYTSTRLESPAFEAESRYQAAVAEFDRLWETCAAKRDPRRMKHLLQEIEAFEQRATTS